jgi:hypothetical protein
LRRESHLQETKQFFSGVRLDIVDKGIRHFCPDHFGFARRRPAGKMKLGLCVQSINLRAADTSR